MLIRLCGCVGLSALAFVVPMCHKLIFSWHGKKKIIKSVSIAQPQTSYRGIVSVRTDQSDERQLSGADTIQFNILTLTPNGKGAQTINVTHVNLCHFFPSSWYQVLAAASTCGSFWTFLFTFSTIYKLQV